ncbi:SHOCT domain-containing protein [Modicisalibacter zincidurans]|uniref:SHOCT domain-containing protein n=1 Tax=Modicisalibacter zincidurans TaxID=1178777 RepID=A0ABP9RCK7_9GAMM|nr:SHOCT domain-containing protein [Halomonas zincidurans]MEA3251866.1 SHOCT domain-containing protein [Pseudomonadota bacterium]
MWGELTADMGRYGWGHMLFGGLMMVLFWGIVIALIILLVRSLTRGRGVPPSQQRPTALNILQERYARGEIDREEYEQCRRDLRQ